MSIDSYLQCFITSNSNVTVADNNISLFESEQFFPQHHKELYNVKY